MTVDEIRFAGSRAPRAWPVRASFRPSVIEGRSAGQRLLRPASVAAPSSHRGHSGIQVVRAGMYPGTFVRLGFQQLDQPLRVYGLRQVMVEAGGEGALLVDILTPPGDGDEYQ